MLIAIIFSAVILIFNLLFFVIGGSDHNAAVWVAYAAIHVAYIIGVATPYLVKKDKNQMVNTMPLVSVVTANLALHLLVGTIIILVNPNNPTATIVTELILLIIFLAVFLVIMRVNADTTSSATRQAEEVFFIRDLSSTVKVLIGRRYMGGKLDRRLERLYDTLFSSPTRSSEAAKPLERELRIKIAELESAVMDEQADEAERFIDEAMLLIDKIRAVVSNDQKKKPLQLKKR